MDTDELAAEARKIYQAFDQAFTGTGAHPTVVGRMMALALEHRIQVIEHPKHIEEQLRIQKELELQRHELSKDSYAESTKMLEKLPRLLQQTMGIKPSKTDVESADVDLQKLQAELARRDEVRTLEGGVPDEDPGPGEEPTATLTIESTVEASVVAESLQVEVLEPIGYVPPGPQQDAQVLEQFAGAPLVLGGTFAARILQGSYPIDLSARITHALPTNANRWGAETRISWSKAPPP